VARRLRIEWRPGLKVTARLAVPAREIGPAVLLGHGAGAGQDHPFMTGLRDRLASAGHLTMTFDYPYMESGRRAPDRADVLIACQTAALARLRDYEARVVLAGKSMGGRMASHLAASGAPAVGLVCYGYPLVRPGASQPRPTDHLEAIASPVLFVSGARDPMAPLELLEPVVDRLLLGSLHVVAEADHSFRVPKRSGISGEAVLAEVVSATVEWMVRAGLRTGS
jgi:predicted alpha/beta-hydrolase family hydrolase